MDQTSNNWPVERMDFDGSTLSPPISDDGDAAVSSPAAA